MPKQVVPYDTSDEALLRAFGQFIAGLIEAKTKDCTAKTVINAYYEFRHPSTNHLGQSLDHCITFAIRGVKGPAFNPAYELKHVVTCLLDARNADREQTKGFKAEQNNAKQRERYALKMAEKEQQKKEAVLIACFDALREDSEPEEG